MEQNGTKSNRAIEWRQPQESNGDSVKTNRKYWAKPNMTLGKPIEDNIKVLLCFATMNTWCDDRCRWLASKSRYSTSKLDASRLVFAPPVAAHRPTVRSGIWHLMAHVQSPTTFAQISSIYHYMMVMCCHCINMRSIRVAWLDCDAERMPMNHHRCAIKHQVEWT